VAALGVLGLQIALLAVTTTLLLYGAVLLEETIAAIARGEAPDLSAEIEAMGLGEPGALAVIVPLAMIGMGGLWVGLGLGHLRAISSILGMLLWAVMCISLAVWIDALDRQGLPPSTIFAEALQSLVGLAEGLPIFVAAVAVGRCGASSRRALRRRRYALAIAGLRARQ